MIKEIKECPRLQLSDGCFYTVASHTNTVQQEQNRSGFVFFELTPEMKTTKTFFVLGTAVSYYQPSFSCNKYHYFTTQAPVLYRMWSTLRETLLRIISGVPWGLDMKMVAFTEVFFFIPPFSFLLTQVLSSPTDTVLMLVTYHRNFCSHHGHHLCRGKIGDMMAFPLSQLRAQSSTTSPSVCTPARVCDYGGNVSNEEWVSLWH